MKLILKLCGEDVATAIEGLFDTVEWDTVGDTLSKGVNGALDVMVAFVENFDKNKVTNAISQIFSHIEWDKIWQKALELIVSNFVRNMLGGRVINWIVKGIDTLAKSITGNVEQAGGNIGKGLLEGLKNAFINIPAWIIDNLAIPILNGIRNGLGLEVEPIGHGIGKDLMQGLVDGIDSFISKIGDKWEEIKTVTTQKFEDIKNVGKEIFNKLWLDILKGSQFAVNKCIEGFNKIIGGINELGQYFGMHLDEIQPVKWADEFEQKMNEVSKTTDETGKSVVNSMGKTMEEMEKGSEGPLNTLGTNFSTTFTKIKESTTGNLSQAEIITKTKTDYIKSLITGNYSEAKKNVDTSMEQIKTNTENNLSKISQSTFFGRIKSSFQTAFDNAKVAETLGSSAGTKYQEGFKNSFTNQNLNDIRWKIQNIFNLGNNAYNWGKDMIDGFMRGIDAAKNALTNTVSRVASSIRSFLHFSRPDEGPLRDYETWFPDMIKGLSDSMLKASPILEDAVSQVSNMVADSLSNIVTPEINQEVYANSYNSEAIRNIGNRTSNITKDETTGNMIRATYEAVSRALSDNKGTEDNRQIVVNVGNKELYRGYGQYKDEESNMLGIRI